MPRPRSLYDRLVAALLWIAAFGFACGVFFSVTLLFRALPPTAPVAIGLVTIERDSKLKDYLGAALFLTLVPSLTILFERAGSCALEAEQRKHSPRRQMLVAFLFTTPFLLAPLFYLTTGKVGWILLLPLALAYAGPRALRFVETRCWFRAMFRPELRPYHALIVAEGLSWILFRYIATGRRIAHYPTLFLETIFVALFIGIFWAIAVYVARLAAFAFAADAEEAFRRISTGALPLVLLPLIPILFVPTPFAATAVAIALVVSALVTLRLRTPLAPDRAWEAAAYIVFPALVYWVSYASSARLSQWIDLFHRGETLGPASDYLRGKAPYREVFALHGMLEDGLLDAWLMQIFGRSLDVAIARTVVVGGFLAVSLWYLGIALFRSIPFATVVVAMSSWTTAENNRTFFQVGAVALFWAGVSRRKPVGVVASGVFAAIALFFSYEIGLYTIAGALATAAILEIFRRRVEWNGLSPLPIAGLFAAGLVIGSTPFVVYLASRGSLVEFFSNSFIVIPAIIDAVWSLPFPDVVSTFRSNLNLHTLADFILWDKFHLIVSPLTIAIATVYSIERWLRRRTDLLDHALLVVAIFAAVAQRTAFGRAEFRHQYYAAFLIGPLLVTLGIVLVRRLRETWREREEGTRAFIAAIIAVTIIVIGVLFWIPDLLNNRIDDLIHYQARQLRIHLDSRAEEVRQRIEAVSSEITRLARRGEPIFDFSNQPAFYFFADRPNPTRFYQVPILSPIRFQAETIGALERARPKVIIRTSPEGFDMFDGVPNSLRAQAVSAYIDDCYRFYKSVRGVELWTRDPRAKAAPLQAYMRLIKVPSKRDLVRSSAARFVFPVIGSTAGINGAHWVSDVTMHNPFRESIEVKLRYISGRVRTDRPVTLAARQTIRWPDAVRTFFAAPETIGALWIEYRAGRAPIIVAKTYDEAHGGREAVEMPLSQRDSATAGSDSNELTIVGIPGSRSQDRRVNVGMVNLGLIPATFRIGVRARNGAQLGREIESGVPEDEVWLVGDIERELGVRIDESTTIRITSIAGTGVAFATIVEPSGEADFIAAIPTQQP